jgi:dienelactone hydrolase
MINRSSLFLLSISLGLGTVTAPSLAATQTELDLPKPDGCYAVGTRSFMLGDPRRSRELVVTVWYPAKEAETALAPYMDKKTADAIAEAWKLQPGFELNVRAHARLSAPIADGGPFSVVLLEHGSGVVPAAYTVLAESLASTGLIVVAANHTPDSLIAVFPDGHVVRSAPYWPVDADRKTQGEAIGKFAEDVLVGDVRFVLDRLAEIELHDVFWRGHLDLSRVGIVGHSMGGTTAAFATREDPRILAGVNLDGSTFPGMNGDVRPVDVHKPFLFVMTEEHASNPDVRGHEYIGNKSNTYYVVVGGTDHMSFTDSHLVASRFGRESPPDNSAFERAVLASELTRSLVEEFLGKYLRSGRAPHLDLNVRVDRK